MHFIRVAEVYHIFLVSSLCPIVVAAVVVVLLAANKDMCVLTYMHCRFCRYRANNAAN